MALTTPEKTIPDEKLPELNVCKYGANAGRRYWAVKNKEGAFTYFRWASEDDYKANILAKWQTLESNVTDLKYKLDELRALISNKDPTDPIE